MKPLTKEERRERLTRLYKLTRRQLRAMIKDEYLHRVEKNYPGYYDKGTLIEIVTAAQMKDEGRTWY